MLPPVQTLVFCLLHYCNTCYWISLNIYSAFPKKGIKQWKKWPATYTNKKSAAYGAFVFSFTLFLWVNVALLQPFLNARQGNQIQNLANNAFFQADNLKISVNTAWQHWEKCSHWYFEEHREGDTKNTSVQPLHILGIRWVIAKQPWVDGDRVVIAMGIFLFYFCQASDTGLVAYKKVGPAGQNSSSELSASSMAWSWLPLPGSPGCWEEEHIFQRRQIAHEKYAVKTPTSCCPVFLWRLRLFLRLRWSILIPYRAPTISRAPEIPIPTGASIPDT